MGQNIIIHSQSLAGAKREEKFSRCRVQGAGTFCTDPRVVKVPCQIMFVEQLLPCTAHVQSAGFHDKTVRCIHVVWSIWYLYCGGSL